MYPAEPEQFDCGMLRRLCPGNMFTIYDAPEDGVLARVVVDDVSYVTYDVDTQDTLWPKGLRDSFGAWLKARHTWSYIFYFSNRGLPTYDFISGH